MTLTKAYSAPLTFWAALLIVVVYLIGWVFPASMMAMRPGEVRIADGQVVLERSFPGDMLELPRPEMSYIETVRPLTPDHNGGHPCVQRDGPFRYISREPVGTWSLDWAEACLSDPSGFYWSARWRWHVWGLTLGPVWASTTVLRVPNGESE